MSQGARNCPFFTFTGFPVRRAGEQEVGLAAEKGGDLKKVDRLRNRRRLMRLVHVRGYRNVETLPYLPQDGASPLETGAPKRLDRAAVGLVERSFEDVRNAELTGDVADALRNEEGMLVVLDDARTRDESEPAATTDEKVSDGNGLGHDISLLMLGSALDLGRGRDASQMVKPDDISDGPRPTTLPVSRFRVPPGRRRSGPACTARRRR